MSERYVVYVQWDRDHTSPPIGPFEGITETEEARARIRKTLRANGHRNPDVRAVVLHEEGVEWGWLSDEKAPRQFTKDGRR